MILRSRSATFRYRVARVHAVYSDGEAASIDEVREFRTLVAAEKYQKRLTDEGETAVLQVGVLQWLPHEEASDRMMELQRQGMSLE